MSWIMEKSLSHSYFPLSMSGRPKYTRLLSEEVSGIRKVEKWLAKRFKNSQSVS